MTVVAKECSCYGVHKEGEVASAAPDILSKE